jgi:pimeloyl-ACP methyl ester carboxylesterase
MHSLAGLAYDERGAGEVVCLVHAGVFSAWFARLFEQPALDGFRVIRPIRPGYGHSPATSEPASIAAQARRCGELLRGLGVTQAHWVGHSNSCCIGLQLALDDPGLVASLTLFEPAKPSGTQREKAASTLCRSRAGRRGPGRPLPRVRRVPARGGRRRLPGGPAGSVRGRRPGGGRR